MAVILTAGDTVSVTLPGAVSATGHVSWKRWKQLCARARNSATMASVTQSLRYPLSMSVVLVGIGAVLLSIILDFGLGIGIVAGIIGIWGIIIAAVGLIAVAVIWLLGRFD